MSSVDHMRFLRVASATVAALLWTVGAGGAQQPGPGAGGSMGQPNPQQNTPGQMPGGQTPGAAPTTPGAGEMGGDNLSQMYVDQEFLRKTFENSMVQEQLGQMAAQKSQSADVKQFGQKMAQIHSQLDNQLQPIAKQIGVNQPKKPSKRDKEEIAKLEALSGPQFDTAFLQTMAKDQQSSLKDFKTEEKDGRDPNAKKAAQLDEPILSQHLVVLSKIAQAHNVPVETDDAKK